MTDDRFSGSPSIVFDLGGVLLDWDPRYLYRKLFDDEAEMEYFLTQVCSPQWNAQQDAGRPFAEAVAELSERFPQYQAMIEAYHTRWDEMLRGAIDGTVEILAELRARGYFLCALSNWSAETFPFARRRFEFLDWFEVIVLSGEEETIKPDPAIYRILLERIGRPARECVFLDDAPRNVRAARDLGFTAVPFESPARLREQLKALDLDV